MHSPLKDPRTRYPGQSLSEQINDITDTQQDEILVPLLLWLVTGLTWLYHFSPTIPNPWIFAFLAFVFTVIAVIRIRRMAAQKKTLKKGIMGEQIIGKYLEEQLMPGKYQLIHDLLFKNGDKTFNIDHVIVGPTGIFSVETKNWTNPDGTHHQIFYDGKKILVDGMVPERDPLVQAVAGAKSIQDILETRTGKHFDVQPVVVFLGSYTTTNPKHAPAWVLNEQVVPIFVKNDFRELSYDDGMLAIAQLKQYSEECGKMGANNT